MRISLFIILVWSSCLSFGQDSLQIDTTHKPETVSFQNNVITDSALPVLKDTAVQKKTQRKKVKKTKIKEPVVRQTENIKDVNDNDNSSGSRIIIVGVLIIITIAILKFFRLFFDSTDTNSSDSSQGDNYLSDYLSRMLLPRREYYRNVYLKSEAWKRKRYVVLKRDNWRCVYCGGKATQVHHTRYAKRNIGKEPIEWLVSICKTCHDSKH